jgi:hypothetical protein
MSLKFGAFKTICFQPLGTLSMDKHASLLQAFINYGCKKFF